MLWILCLNAGYQSEESPGKCLGYLCENCEFLRHKFFLEDLVADRVLECRLGTTRDREKWAAVRCAVDMRVCTVLASHWPMRHASRPDTRMWRISLNSSQTTCSRTVSFNTDSIVLPQFSWMPNPDLCITNGFIQHTSLDCGEDIPLIWKSVEVKVIPSVTTVREMSASLNCMMYARQCSGTCHGSTYCIICYDVLYTKHSMSVLQRCI